MGKAFDDDPHRRLTAAEYQAKESHADVLRVLTEYLSGDQGGWDTLAEAYANLAAVATRTRHTPEGLPPVVVNPEFVVTWARRRGGTAAAITVTQVAAALSFMGGLQVVTFRPRGEPLGSVRRRPGWFRLSSEVNTRLTMGNYTPVLSRGPGRVAAQELVAGEVGAPRLGARAVPVAETVDLLRDYLRVGPPPTPLLSMATRFGVPLLRRFRGRPSALDPFSAYDLSRVLVSAQGLARYSVVVADRLGQRPAASAAQVREALARVCAARPGLVAVAPTVRAPDMGRSVVRTVWWFEVCVPLLSPGLVLDTAAAREELAWFTGWAADEQRRLGRPLVGREGAAFMNFIGDHRRSA
jgi:hypothetical protein